VVLSTFVDLQLKPDPGAAKRLTAESLTPLLRGRITRVDVPAKRGVSWALPSTP
jgi:hypothetical protein